MPARKRGESRTPFVTIVSRNAETLDGLQHYLDRAGVPARTTAALGDLSAVAPDDATATVVFPDDFPEKTVLAVVAELRRKRSRLLILLVTRSPDRLRAALRADDERLPMPTLLPKPPFGWLILDAVRGEAVKPHV